MPEVSPHLEHDAHGAGGKLEIYLIEEVVVGSGETGVFINVGDDGPRAV